MRIMRIMIDFKGGPLDGSASLEREIKAGDSLNYLEMVIMTMGATSGYKFNIGHHFHVPSPGWLAHTVVHRPTPPGVFPCFEYVIVDRVEAPDELLVVAKFVGPRPDPAEAK
jgi:hypothetical protein